MADTRSRDRDGMGSAGASESGSMESRTYTDPRPTGLGPDDRASCRVPPLSEGACPICESGEGMAVSGQLLPVCGTCGHQCVQRLLIGFPPWPLPACALDWVSGCF